jgi:hypothetical protein
VEDKVNSGPVNGKINRGRKEQKKKEKDPQRGVEKSKGHHKEEIVSDQVGREVVNERKITS